MTFRIARQLHDVGVMAEWSSVGRWVIILLSSVWTVYLSAWFLNSAMIWKSICSAVHIFTDTVQQWNYSRRKKRGWKDSRDSLMNVRPLDNVKIIHDKGYQIPMPLLQYRLQSSSRYKLMFLGNGVKVQCSTLVFVTSFASLLRYTHFLWMWCFCQYSSSEWKEAAAI